MNNSKKYILVLGGSTFMGLKLLELLCSNAANEVYFINRGKKYWNNRVKSFKNAHHVFGNRKEKQEYRKLIEYESDKLGITAQSNLKWTAVYDFCAFKFSEVKIAYEALQGRTDLYLFISTDSIYDACDVSVRKGGPIKEEMACRPTTLRAIEKLKNDDEYAHNKLKCEEYLHNFVSKEDFPFVILRLPDVIGPYDDTGRFWAYMKWISDFSSSPLYLDEEANKQKMCLVYSEDVAKMCVQLITMDKSQILYQSFNVGFNETLTLKELLSKIADLMDVKLVNIKDKDSAGKFYPSVDCGPIDISKAKELLGWSPSKLDAALKTTVEFFKGAKGLYKDEEHYAEKKLKKKIKVD